MDDHARLPVHVHVRHKQKDD